MNVIAKLLYKRQNINQDVTKQQKGFQQTDIQRLKANNKTQKTLNKCSQNLRKIGKCDCSWQETH